MKKVILISLLAILPVFMGCNDYVTGIDKFIDKIQDDQLADRSQLTFLQNGLLNSFAQTLDYTTIVADGLSDALVYDAAKNPDATYDTFRDIDESRLITRQNSSVSTATVSMGEFRYVADDFLVKIGKMKFEANDPAEKTAKFYGNFFGGISRYFYASYVGLDKTVGGAPEVNTGPFVPSAQLYVQAVDLLKKSLEFADAEQIKITNTVIARIYIVQNKYTEAEPYVTAGLQKGDAAFKALYSVSAPNTWVTYAGNTRAQWTVDPRFVAYSQAEPARVRIKVYNKTFRQDKHAMDESPITFVNWQENLLMKAEIALNKSDNATALAAVNEVRSSYNLTALTAVDMDVLLVERDKELFCQGMRLIDQRRHSKFHITDGWQYLPIQQAEADRNPNITLPN